MSIRSRRSVLGLLGVGTAGVATYALSDDLSPEAKRSPISEPTPQTVEPAVSVPSHSLAEENRLAGSRDWLSDPEDPMASGDRRRQIQGYASATSVGHGEVIDFHVSVHDWQHYRISVFRLGDYSGTGARLLTTSSRLQGRRRTVPESDPHTGSIACDWPVSWSLRVPSDWMSGLYQAVFTTEDGHRASTPFVVREPDRASDILVVLPFTTYQAYNMWPMDGRTGKNLYRGYLENGKVGAADERAYKVSFDRPYAQSGIPKWFQMDTSFVRWVERAGRDVTYASSVDLHEGAVDTAKYRAVFFPGHDEYWSRPMLDSAKKSVSAGTHLAFLAANNVYFHVRMESSADGRANRMMACYKTSPDPTPDKAGHTSRWRDVVADGRHAEQGLLGIQFNGILNKPAPLVVKESGHWLWAGTGLRDGHRLPRMIGVEADGYDPKAPSPAGATRTLLAESSYRDKRGAMKRRVQHTALTEYPNGAMVFMAGTFHWALALDDPGHRNRHVQTATANLVDEMLRDRRARAESGA
ncbi:N,N-dimethylformamidase beta subunit family domain-containing protein [Streptomyces sp. NPDC000410]|uniref:N,N-dimethylformamidase beta subunit family domain-containing protein n=1 Tax=Streptomyces sp. NPDC000410 TaxID=3154254 RepID=UPI003331FFDD